MTVRTEQTQPVAPPRLDALLGTAADEATRRAELRRAKRGATGLLAVAALVFLATFLADDDGGVIGFIRAAAEAGLVGGLADWFAVTALFRRPLGLPIPHTGLIPSRKDALAASLGGFVTGHFLTRENILGRLADAGLVTRVGARLATPEVAERVSHELIAAGRAALDAVRADDVVELLIDVARHNTARRSYASLAGRLLASATEGGAHRPLLDVALPYLRGSIVTNRAAVRELVKTVGERNGVLGWLWASDKRVDRLIDDVVAALSDMERDPDHELRRALDRLLAEFATDLQGGGRLARQVETLLRDVLADPGTRRWLVEVTEGLLGSVRETLADPQGAATRWVARTLAGLGARAVEDADFRQRLERLLERVVLYVVDNYAEEFTRLIEDTVARWDGPATADRIEIAAGRDLQFIRINGTVVGALAGVAIHAISLALP